MSEPSKSFRKDSTLSIHAGDPPRRVGEPLAQPPVLSTSYYSHPDVSGFSALEMGEDPPHFYTRWSNPTNSLLESKLAALEHAEAAVTFASGMGALSALFLDRLKSGDHLVVSNVCYAGTAEFTLDTLPPLGIEVSHVDSSDPQKIEDAIRPNTRLVHIETPANPILKITDIAAIAEITKRRGVELSVDSTIATPIATKPIQLGADYVVHSLTKYLCGHGDAIAGAVIGSKVNVSRLRKKGLVHLGGCLSPFSAWLVLRGLETLAPRMALHESNARRIEEFLANHSSVERVFWPGSTRHPQHELAKKQMKNFSGLLAFTTRDRGGDLASQIAAKAQVFTYAVSLGKTRSLIFHIPTNDLLRASFRFGPDAESEYRRWGGEGVFRVSVGLEDADDLIEDLDSVLSSEQ